MIVERVLSYEFFHQFRSLKENISVELYYKEYDPHYKISLTFTDLYDQDKVISKSPSTEGLLKSDYGPDEIFIKIQGKALYSYIPTHKKEAIIRESRTYEQFFRVDFSGSYHMMGFRIRENYGAIDELNSSFPDVHYTNLFSEWIFLNSTIANKDADLWYCNDEVPGNWVERVNDSKNPSIFDSSPEFLQNFAYPVKINTKHFIYGDHYTFVNISSFKANRNCLETIEYFEWKPSLCSGGIYYNSQEASDILRNKYIALQGDSQTRTFLHQLLSYACDNVTFDGSGKHPFIGKGQLCEGLKIEYTENFYCEQLTNTSKYADLILVNCGQRPASGTHMKLEKYKNIVRTMLDDSYARNFSSKRIVWFETVPFPLRVEASVIKFRDWRTLHRLSSFNKYSNELFSQRGHKIIRSFNPLLTFWDQLCDDAHPIEKHAHDASIQQVLHVLKVLSKST